MTERFTVHVRTDAGRWDAKVTSGERYAVSRGHARHLDAIRAALELFEHHELRGCSTDPMNYGEKELANV